MQGINKVDTVMAKQQAVPTGSSNQSIGMAAREAIPRGAIKKKQIIVLSDWLDSEMDGTVCR
jgi:hypothetical protein